MHDISRMNNHFSSECECLHTVLNANACTEWLMELCADSLCTVIDIINHDQSRQPSTNVHTHEDGNSATKWRNEWPQCFRWGFDLDPGGGCVTELFDPDPPQCLLSYYHTHTVCSSFFSSSPPSFPVRL